MKMNLLMHMMKALLVIAFCLTEVLSAAVSDEKDEPKSNEWKAIHAGTLLAIPGQDAKLNKTIVIKNNHIVSVEDGYSTPEIDAGDTLEVIDLKKSFVMPGLMDMHVHLDMSGPKWSRTRKDDAAEAYRLTAALENARITLAAGYTTVRNPGGTGWAIAALKNMINNEAADGPRIFFSGHTIHVGGGDASGECSGVESCRQAVRRQIDMGVDFIKVYATCSGSQPCGHGIANPVFLDDEMKAVIDTAKTRQIKVAAHAHAVAGINQALSLGVDSIEHGTFSNSKSYKLYKKNNVFMVPTIAVQDNVIRDYKKATDADMRYVMKNAIDSHPRSVRGAYKAGVKIAAGSDAGVIPHGNNANELLWYVNKVGMSTKDALVTATLNGAKLIGKSDQLGSIESGKLADIVAMPENPLKKIEAIKDVNFVMKNGKVYQHLN